MRLALLMKIHSAWSRKIAAQLADLGVEVHVIAFTEDEKNDDQTVVKNVHTLNDIKQMSDAIAGTHEIHLKRSSNLNYITQASKLGKICRDNKIDLLFTLYGGGFALSAYLSGFRPYAIYAVGSDVLLISSIFKLVSRYTFGASSLVFANGRYLAGKTKVLAPGANVVPLLMGVDTDKFSPDPQRSLPVRLICTRNFMPVYNNEAIIHALSRLQNFKHDYTLVFTTSGPLLSSVQKLSREILTPKQLNQIEFSGRVSDQMLLERVKKSHIYISMSRSDGTSTAMLEALACGLFPVLSDIPQNREWVDPVAKNGILVPLDDPDALAEAIALAISDDDLRQKATDYNRNLALERASSQRNIATMAKMLQEIVGKRKVKGR